jgi:hypothetical protein
MTGIINLTNNISLMTGRGKYLKLMKKILTEYKTSRWTSSEGFEVV